MSEDEALARLEIRVRRLRRLCNLSAPNAVIEYERTLVQDSIATWAATAHDASVL